MERTYYIRGYSRSIEYQPAHSGFFKDTPAKFIGIMFYCEEGKFYEFFTGHCLGTEGGEYILSEEFGPRIRLFGDSWSARRITPEEFATEVKKYMPDKEKICVAMEKEFDKWRQIRKQELQRAREEERKQQQAAADANWLESMLDSRNGRL